MEVWAVSSAVFRLRPLTAGPAAET
jgi:hypothetical protein